MSESTTVICPNKDQIFTEVKEGTELVIKYDIVNDGLSAVMINSVQTSCGCTVGQFDKNPIQPNGRSTVELRFNSAGRRGNNFKTALVYGTFQPPIALTFHATVV